MEDPRRIENLLHDCDGHLTAFEAAILMYKGLYELLQEMTQKVEGVMEQALEYLKEAEQDGIPDSFLTTELIAEVKKKHADWSELEGSILSKGKSWSEIRYQLDFFMESSEVLAIRFGVELDLARSASKML